MCLTITVSMIRYNNEVMKLRKAAAEKVHYEKTAKDSSDGAVRIPEISCSNK